MTDQTQRDDLVERLRRVESGSPRGEFTTNWHRNPDGPEAADRIERLERALREIDELARLVGDADEFDRGVRAARLEARDIALAALRGQEG